MNYCGYSVCPHDSHEKIKEIATVICQKNGGDGVVMELISEIIEIDYVNIFNNSRI